MGRVTKSLMSDASAASMCRKKGTEVDADADADAEQKAEQEAENTVAVDVVRADREEGVRGVVKRVW